MARADFQKALQEFRAKANGPGEGVTLILLATAEIHLDNASVARAHLHSASRIFRERKDAVGIWLALAALAQLERATGHYGAALASQDEAQRVIETAMNAEESLSLKSFDLMAAAFGLPGIDLAGAPPGAGLFLQAFLLPGMARPVTHDAYAGILIEVGQYERAEKELRAAVTAAGPIAAQYQYSIAAHLGELRYRQRRFAEARGHYEKALQGSLRMPFNPLGEQWIKVGIYGRLAELNAAENRFDEALAWNDRALQTVRGAENRLKETAVLEERGVLLMQAGRLVDAESALHQALRIAIAIQSDTRRASIETRLADVSFLTGNYGTAVSHLEEAIRLHQRLNDQVTEGLVWTQLAVMYLLTSMDDAAGVLIERARTLAEVSSIELVCDVVTLIETVQKFRRESATAGEVRSALDRLTTNPQFRLIDIRGDAERSLRDSLPLGDTVPATVDSQKPAMAIYAALAYSNEGRRQLESGNTGPARQFFEKALAVNPAGELRARIQAAIGACHWRERNAAQSVHWFSEAAKTLEKVLPDLRSESMLVSFLGSADRRAYYDVLIEALLEEHHAEEAFEVTERARARGFLRMGTGRDTASRDNGSGLAVKAAEVLVQIEQWSTSPVPGTTLDELRLRYELLRSRLQSVSQGDAFFQPLTLPQIRRELPVDTTLVSYFISPLGAHAWVVDAEGVEHVDLGLDDGRMKQITCWAAQFGRPRGSAEQRGAEVKDCGSDPALAGEVYAALIAPLRSRIRNRRLMILPHGDLHYVPFAALRDPQHNRYLVEDYTISYLPSASALPLLRARESKMGGDALVLGDPEASGQTRLRGANKEAHRVASTLQAKAMTGKDATKDLLYGLGNVDLLHIAAHGIHDPAGPRFSAIFLAGSDERSGVLTVEEIQSRLDLWGVNLVVLAVCQSGVGARSGGDDVVSLTRAFLYAGSPGVISALWNIDDEGTAPLIEKFYRHLVTGSTAAEALREAQLAMLRDAKYSDPHYWAAFHLTGDPQGKLSAGPASHAAGRR